MVKLALASTMVLAAQIHVHATQRDPVQDAVDYASVASHLSQDLGQFVDRLGFTNQPGSEMSQLLRSENLAHKAVPKFRQTKHGLKWMSEGTQRQATFKFTRPDGIRIGGRTIGLTDHSLKQVYLDIRAELRREAKTEGKSAWYDWLISKAQAQEIPYGTDADALALAAVGKGKPCLQMQFPDPRCFFDKPEKALQRLLDRGDVESFSCQGTGKSRHLTSIVRAKHEYAFEYKFLFDDSEKLTEVKSFSHRWNVDDVLCDYKVSDSEITGVARGPGYAGACGAMGPIDDGLNFPVRLWDERCCPSDDCVRAMNSWIHSKPEHRVGLPADTAS